MFLRRRLLTFVSCSVFALMSACTAPTSTDSTDEESETDDVATGTSISFSDLYDQDLTVSWGDASGGVGDLEYKLVTSLDEDDIDTVDEADALTGASVLMDWSTDTSKALTGLTVGDYNFYAVVVRDEDGNKELYTPKGRVQGKAIYKTVAEYDGNLGGVAGADAKCAASQPEGVDTTASVRAFIGHATDRWACVGAGQCDSTTDGNDWVLTPAWDFYSLYGEKIGTMAANENIFSAITAALYPDGVDWQDTAYTGFYGDFWTIGPTCNGWTSNNSGVNGAIGHTGHTDGVQFWGAALMSCDTLAPLICVEQ